MGVPIAKPLIPLMGRKLVDYSLEAAANFCSNEGLDIETGVVVGHQKEEVINHFKGSNLKLSFPVQKEQRGNG